MSIKNSKKQNKRLSPKYFNALIISIICVLLVFAEIILSNTILLKCTVCGYGTKVIKLSGNTNVRQESDAIYIDNIDTAACSLGISAVGAETYSDIQIMMLDENFAYEYQLAGKYRFFCGKNETTDYFKINPAGKLKSLKISASSKNSNFSLTNIIINPKPPFGFNFFRYILFCVVICGIFVIIRKKAYNIEYDKSNNNHIAVLAFIIAVCII
ncbi:MAG: hypothetical protein IKI11_03105, partial [Neisseriaceae bacterium]|nr:hypothetical protein [Neisseriaceae bacterium]